MVVIGHNASDARVMYDINDFVEFLEKHDISKQDLVDFISQGLSEGVDWLEDGIFGKADLYLRGRVDGIYGDDWYEYQTAVHNLGEEVEAEVENLRSKSRKNNTKEDIARRLDNVVSNIYNLSY